MMAIFSTQHPEKLNDKNVLKRGSDLLQKIDKDLEKTGIIDIIEGRPVFLHRTFAEYFVSRLFCDSTMASQILMRDHSFESGFGVVRSMVDRILANKFPLHQAVLNSNMPHVEGLLKTNHTEGPWWKNPTAHSSQLHEPRTHQATSRTRSRCKFCRHVAGFVPCRLSIQNTLLADSEFDDGEMA
jgi:hypothetical protein